MSDITIAVCNYNTASMTNACLCSIVEKSGLHDINIIVLDNSDREKFVLDSKLSNLVKVIDNTTDKYLHTSSIMQMLNIDKQMLLSNRCASLKHCLAIDFLIKICTTDKLIIVDSDAILKQRIDFADSDAVTVADLEIYGKLDKRKRPRQYNGFTRFAPYIQMFNVKKMHTLKLRYFDYRRIQGICGFQLYDTGASFYEDIIRTSAKYDVIDYTKYVDHLEHGSWRYQNRTDLTFLCATDDRNFPFTLPFIYFASKYNQNSQFDIHIFRSAQQDYSKFEQGVKFLLYDCNVKNINVKYVMNSIHRPQNYRFIVDPVLKSKYTYIGDIDIMICESITSFHLAKMTNDYAYDNEIRGYSDPTHFSGLHFATRKWFDQTAAYRHELSKLNTTSLNDEQMLADMAIRSNVRIRPILYTQQQFNDARPIHGQHISLSRKPFRENSHMSVVLDEKFHQQFIDTIAESKFKALVSQFCPKQTTNIIEKYMSFVGLSCQI